MLERLFKKKATKEDIERLERKYETEIAELKQTYETEIAELENKISQLEVTRNSEINVGENSFDQREYNHCKSEIKYYSNSLDPEGSLYTIQFFSEIVDETESLIGDNKAFKKVLLPLAELSSKLLKYTYNPDRVCRNKMFSRSSEKLKENYNPEIFKDLIKKSMIETDVLGNSQKQYNKEEASEIATKLLREINSKRLETRYLLGFNYNYPVVLSYYPTEFITNYAKEFVEKLSESEDNDIDLTPLYTTYFLMYAFKEMVSSDELKENLEKEGKTAREEFE